MVLAAVVLAVAAVLMLVLRCCCSHGGGGGDAPAPFAVEKNHEMFIRVNQVAAGVGKI